MRLSPLIIALAAAASAQTGGDVPIDTQRSTITIHVGKAGLFSAAGHEHWVSAPLSAGKIRESGDPHIEFTVKTAKMTVKPDPKVDESTRAQVQKDMEVIVLETSKYPEISFRSSRVSKTAEGQWTVDGTLTLHGASKPVHLIATRTGQAYEAHAMVKQTDFGIKPVSVGGGAIKVKNVVEIDFEIFPGKA